MPLGAHQPSLRQSGSRITLKRKVGPIQRISRYPIQVMNQREIRWRRVKRPGRGTSAIAGAVCDGEPTNPDSKLFNQTCGAQASWPFGKKCLSEILTLTLKLTL